MKYVAKRYTLNQSGGQRPVPREKNDIIEGDKTVYDRGFLVFAVSLPTCSFKVFQGYRH